MGGGATSGTITYPTHMVDMHQDWLGHTAYGANSMDQSIVDLMKAAMSGASPYNAAEYTDPATDLGAVQASVEDLLIKALGSRATAVLTAIQGNDFINNEGFTLVGGNVVSYVFKFSKDGVAVTGEDVKIDVTGDVAADCTIIAVAKADLVDTEIFTLVDEGGTSRVFEFDLPPDGITGGRTLVDISGVTTAVDVAEVIRAAVDGHSSFSATRSNVQVFVTQATAGSAGNRTNSEGVTDVGFTVSDFTGGTDQDSVAEVATIILNAIDGYVGFGAVLQAGSTTVLDLAQTILGTLGNQANAETVANATFDLTDFTGAVGGPDRLADWAAMAVKAKEQADITGFLTDDHVTSAMALIESWSDMLEDARSRVNESDTLPHDYVQEILEAFETWSDIVEDAKSKVDSLLEDEYIAALLESFETWATIIDEAVSKVDESGVLPDSYIAKVVGAAISRLDWADILEDAEDSIDDRILSTFIDTVVDAYTNRVNWSDIVDAVDTKLSSIWSSNYINSVVTAQEDDTLPEFQRGASRFAAGMADVNAVQSSAFMSGMALLESQRLRDLARFRAEKTEEFEKIRMTLLGTLADLDSRILMGISQAEINLQDSYQTRRAGALMQAVELDGKSLMEISQLDMQLTDAYRKMRAAFVVDIARVRADVSLEKSRSEVTLRDTFEGRKTEFLGMLSTLRKEVSLAKSAAQTTLEESYYSKRADVMTALMESRRQLSTDKARIQGMLDDSYQKLRTSYIEQGTREMVTLLQHNNSYAKVVTDLMTETRRIKILMTQERQAREIDLDLKDSLFDLNIYRYGMNVLGGISGATGYLPEKESIGASVVSGALGGAGLGAQVGGAMGAAGGPAGIAAGALMGAGVGTVLGAIGGAL